MMRALIWYFFFRGWSDTCCLVSLGKLELKIRTGEPMSTCSSQLIFLDFVLDEGAFGFSFSNFFEYTRLAGASWHISNKYFTLVGNETHKSSKEMKQRLDDKKTNAEGVCDCPIIFFCHIARLISENSVDYLTVTGSGRFINTCTRLYLHKW